MNSISCEIHKTRKNENSFVVALLSVPAFPGDLPHKRTVRYPLQAVIAANDDDGAWGFVSLDGKQKHCIGDKLNELGIPVGKWMYCNLY